MRDIRNAEIVLIESPEEFESVKKQALSDDNNVAFIGDYRGSGYYAKLVYTKRDNQCTCGGCYITVHEYLTMFLYTRELKIELNIVQDLLDEADKKSAW